MARNFEPRRDRTEFADRAFARADTGDWRALASTAVTSALIVALAVTVVALIDAVFSRPASDLAQRSPHPETQRWRASELQPVLFFDFCARREPLSCLAD